MNDQVFKKLVRKKVLRIVRRRKINWLEYYIRQDCLLKALLEGVMNMMCIRDRNSPDC